MNWLCLLRAPFSKQSSGKQAAGAQKTSGDNQTIQSYWGARLMSLDSVCKRRAQTIIQSENSTFLLRLKQVGKAGILVLELPTVR